MTETERTIRAQIASEIAAKFGSLAPYKNMQDFVRTGQGQPTKPKGQKEDRPTDSHTRQRRAVI